MPSASPRPLPDHPVPDHPVPNDGPSSLVVEPPVPVAGGWAGGPSAVVADGVTYLAYRLRRPVGEGRGYANVVARSDDGVAFETICELLRDDFGGDSLERPALVRTPQGRWRVYVSVATPGTRHWRVDVVEAADPGSLSARSARTVLPGDAGEAVKDPVVLWHAGGWHLWASCHPLDDPDATDRMSTRYATSPDGLDWTWQGTALTGRPGCWDARGVRVSSVLVRGDELLATYDGRATSQENWEERTGTARGTLLAAGLFGPLTATGPVAARSPHPPHGLRYVTAVPAPDDRLRLYYETTRADGAHELRTQLA
jgi:hypothetical protein